MMHVTSIKVGSVAIQVTGEAVDNEDHEGEDGEVLYGRASLLIVGCKYYRGVAHKGEYVSLVREQRNPYDKNAIRVDNLSRLQVRHIKAPMAAALAPVLDSQSASAPRVEAMVTAYGTGMYTLPVMVYFFGPPEGAKITLKFLQRRVFKMRDGLAGLEGYEASNATPQVLVKTSVSDPVKMQKVLDEMFDKLDINAAGLPMESACNAALPLLTVTLMSHQRESLTWMMQRETKPDANGLPPFWEKRKEKGARVYYNVITCSSQGAKPASVHGGILADDMGLGKTLQTISIILPTPPQAKTTLVGQRRYLPTTISSQNWRP
ncbi:unnamed protein product [Choristocarpus tenellus]